MVLISSNYIQAQNTSDTICINTSQFKKIYTAALQKRSVDSLLQISESQISELQFQIELLQQKDTATVNGYLRQLQDLKGQVANYVLEKKEYERLLKWERFKRRFWTSVGGAAIGIVGFLYLTK